MHNQTESDATYGRDDQPTHTCCPIVELRQYTLHPGKRDVLIDLFEHAFIESQEDVGIRVIGQFRDRAKPDRFVWLRGFPDMPARAKALQDFYGGPVWAANRNVANSTMIDSDNVLLLRPARPSSGFAHNGGERPAPDATEARPGFVVATIYYLTEPANEATIDFFENAVTPAVVASGASVLGFFVTESSANTFPALPVREGEYVFIAFLGFPNQAVYQQHSATLARADLWHTAEADTLAHPLKGEPEVIHLMPTARTQLHG